MPSSARKRKSISRGAMPIVLAALVSALLTAAIAFGNGGGVGHHGGSKLAHNLTYAEIHYQKNGNEVVKRIDRGTVKSVASDSVTITRNDGQDVTIPVDGSTKVSAGSRQRR